MDQIIGIYNNNNNNSDRRGFNTDICIYFQATFISKEN